MKLNKGRLKEIKEGMNRTDLAIITITTFLCCFGLVMIYSASSYECSMSADYNYDSFYYLKNQLKYVLLGFAGMAFVYFFIRDDFFGKLAHLAYGGSVLCILLLAWREMARRDGSAWDRCSSRWRRSSKSA